MIPTLFGFFLFCATIQAFGYILGLGWFAVKDVQAYHREGKDPVIAARRAKNDKKVRKFMFWVFVGMAIFVVWMEMLKAQGDTPTETTTLLVDPTPTPAPTPSPTPTPTPTRATKVYVKSDSTEWIPNCGFRISYGKGNDDYVVEARIGETKWTEVFRSPVWFYVQKYVCDKYPATCSKVAVQPAPKSVKQSSTSTQRKSRPRKREQASDDEQSSYEQRRLEQRMSRPPGTPWRNFSADDEHGYPNN